MSPVVIVGVDFSEGSELAIRHALEIAKRMQASITLLQVGWVPGPPQKSQRVSLWESASLRTMESDRLSLTDLMNRYGEHNVPLTPLSVAGRAAETMAETAAHTSAALLVVGAHGQTALEHFALGSVAERTVRLAQTPVLVARGPHIAGGYRRALVAVDLSDDIGPQMKLALELTEPTTPVDVLHVWRMPVLHAEIEAMAGALHADSVAAVDRDGESAVARFRGAGRKITFMQREGIAKHAVLDLAKQGGYDLIVLGHHRRGTLARWFLGSVAEGVLRHASCSVAVVPPLAKEQST